MFSCLDILYLAQQNWMFPANCIKSKRVSHHSEFHLQTLGFKSERSRNSICIFVLYKDCRTVLCVCTVDCVCRPHGFIACCILWPHCKLKFISQSLQQRCCSSQPEEELDYLDSLGVLKTCSAVQPLQIDLSSFPTVAPAASLSAQWLSSPLLLQCDRRYLQWQQPHCNSYDIITVAKQSFCSCITGLLLTTSAVIYSQLCANNHYILYNWLTDQLRTSVTCRCSSGGN